MIIGKGTLVTCGKAAYWRGACSAETHGVLDFNQRLGIIVDENKDESGIKVLTYVVDTEKGRLAFPRSELHPIVQLPRWFNGTPQEAFLKFGPAVLADLNERLENLENGFSYHKNFEHSKTE